MPLPVFGYKKPQRVCNNCYQSRVSAMTRSTIYANILSKRDAITDSDRTENATPSSRSSTITSSSDLSFLNDFEVISGPVVPPSPAGASLNAAAVAVPVDGTPAVTGVPLGESPDLRQSFQMHGGFSFDDLTHAIEERYDLYDQFHPESATPITIVNADDTPSESDDSSISAPTIQASTSTTSSSTPSTGESLDLSSWERISNTIIKLRVLILLVGSRGDVQVRFITIIILSFERVSLSNMSIALD